MSLGEERKSHMKPMIAVFWCVLLLSAGCTKQAPEHPPVTPEGDVIKIPVNAVNDGGVHFYTYKYEEKNINFFVRTNGKGKLHAHYDACYSCYKYKMGFRVEGSEILCIACNLKYSLNDEMWDYIGPCTDPPPQQNQRRFYCD